MKHVTGTLAAVFAALTLGGSDVRAAEQHGSYQENKRWGYKVRAPRNWKRRTIRLDEQWIADRFYPDYDLRARGDTRDFVTSKPELWVIGFPLERERERVKREKKGDLTVITVRNPYKDYKDFVKREEWAAAGGGGWYFSREDRIEHDGYVVDVYEIKVEKLVLAPLRIVTWVYHCEGVNFAVQIRILEEHYAANENVIEGCMKSFKEIPRTEPFPTEDEPRVRTTEKELTLGEINAERVRKIEKRIERELANLPKGWRAQESKHFIALTQVEKKYTGYVLKFAESIRAYLEDHFADLGPSEVPRGLIRVFSSSEEEHTYQQGTRGWWVDEVGEITMSYGRDSSILFEFSWLADRLTDQYFHIKNENLRWGMPGWIRYGISSHIRWARPSKRKKMILQPSPGNVRAMALLLANDQQLPLRTLMTVSTDDYDSYEQHEQAASVVFWLLNKNSRGKLKGAVSTYLQSLETIIKEEDEKFEKAESERMRTEAQAAAERAEADRKKTEEELEAEEDERFRQRRQNRNQFSETLKAKYQAIRDRAFDAAFGHLTEKDWISLDKKWQKFAKP